MDMSACFLEYVRSLEEVTEAPHFDVVSFRYGKRIFATLNTKEHRSCVRLNAIDQSAFSSYRKDVMYPVPNKWGKLGWTNINLDLVPEEMMKDAIQTAYDTLRYEKKKKKA